MTLILQRYSAVPLYGARGPCIAASTAARDSERATHPSSRFPVCVVEEGVGSGSDLRLEGIPNLGGDAYNSVIASHRSGREELVGVNNLSVPPTIRCSPFQQFLS